MTEEIKRYLDKADHAIIVAEDLMGQGHAPDAASNVLRNQGPVGFRGN